MTDSDNQDSVAKETMKNNSIKSSQSTKHSSLGISMKESILEKKLKLTPINEINYEEGTFPENGLSGFSSKNQRKRRFRDPLPRKCQVFD